MSHMFMRRNPRSELTLLCLLEKLARNDSSQALGEQAFDVPSQGNLDAMFHVFKFRQTLLSENYRGSFQ